MLNSAERRCELWSRIKTDNLAMHMLDSEDYEQVEAWTAFLDFERANPMNLEASAFVSWMKRCIKRCLGCCQYSPDMWMYCMEYVYSIKKEDAMEMMERAIAALPNCLLLRIRICEFYEAIGEVTKADLEYRHLVKDCKIAVPWIMYQQFTRRNFGIQAARDVFERARLSCKAPSLYIAAGKPRRSIRTHSSSRKRRESSACVRVSDSPLRFHALFAWRTRSDLRDGHGRHSARTSSSRQCMHHSPTSHPSHRGGGSPCIVGALAADPVELFLHSNVAQ